MGSRGSKRGPDSTPPAGIEEIEVGWPVSDQRQRLRDVPVDSAFPIREGRDVLDPVEWETIEIGKTKIAAPMLHLHP